MYFIVQTNLYERVLTLGLVWVPKDEIQSEVVAALNTFVRFYVKIGIGLFCHGVLKNHAEFSISLNVRKLPTD